MRESYKIFRGFGLLIGSFLAALFFLTASAQAAAGINQQLNFQGKVVNTNGTNIADGTYNMQFKIYQDGTSSGSGSTLKWTENYLVSGSGGVTVTSGTFNVALGSHNAFGSSVDWNQDTLWLSFQVGNTSSCAISTSFQTDCSGDGEMTPFIRLTAVPQAMNSDRVGGLTASQLVQLTPSSQQTGSINVSGNITSGGTVTANTLTVQPVTDSTSVLQVLRSSGNGGATILAVDTQNSQAIVANLTPTSGATITINSYQSVDDTGTMDVQNYSVSAAQAIGSDGFSRFLFYDAANNLLKFVQCTDANCSAKNITTIGTSGIDGGSNIRREASIAMGTDGLARILFQDISDNLKFVQCTNASCSTNNVTTITSNNDSIGNVSLAIGTDGFARFAYYGVTSYDLVFVQCTNATCSTKNTNTVESTGQIGAYPSVVLGSDGFARIGYHDVTNSALKFAQCTNAACTTSNITIVDNTADVGQASNIAMGSDGFARIGYYDNTNHSLKFAQCTNAACTTNAITTIYSTYFVRQYSSLDMGSDGFARLSFVAFDPQYSGEALHYVQCTNATCSTNTEVTVDGKVYTGFNPSLKIGSDGFARISYYSSTYQTIKYLRLVSDDAQEYTTGATLGGDTSAFAAIFSKSAKVQGSLTVDNPSLFTPAITINGGGTYLVANAEDGTNLLYIADSKLKYKTETTNAFFSVSDNWGGYFGNYGDQSVCAGGCGGALNVEKVGTGDALFVTKENSNGMLARFTQNWTDDVFTIAGTGDIVAKPTTNSTTTFQMQNTNAKTVVVFDTTNGKVILGDQSATNGVTGQLTFYTANNANAVSIQAGATSTAYSLTLPTSGAAGSNCLKSTTGSTTAATALEWGACGSGGVTWPLTHTGAENFQPNSISNNALGITNNASSVNGLTITGTASGTDPILGSTAGISLQPTSGLVALNRPSTNNELRVYENSATPTNYATISYSGGAAIFGSSSGNVQLGLTSGDVTMPLTGTSDEFSFTKTVTTGNTSYTSNSNGEFGISRNITAGTSTVSGTVVKIQDASTGSGGVSGDLLLINQSTATATGNLLRGQLNGSDKFTVTTAGNVTAGGNLVIQGTGSSTFAGNIDQSASSGTLQSGSGNVSLNGNTTVTGTKTFTVSGGLTTLSAGVTVSGGAVSITGNAASSISTSTGTLTVGSTNASTNLLASLSTTSTTGILIGTDDANQTNLVLDASSAFTDAGTCSTIVNEGATYYNSTTNAIRSCINGTWEDIVSTAGLGILAFGVVVDTGSNAGDIQSLTTASAATGPCQPYRASATSVGWTACSAYSSGRKIIVAAGTQTTTNSVAGNFQHLCLTGTNKQPTLSTSAAETSSTQLPAFSATNPVLCLADIKFAAGNNTITEIYDTRVFSTSQKAFAYTAVALAPGRIVTASTAKVTQPAATAGLANVMGVVGVTDGTTVGTNGAPNAIIVNGGPAFVKATAGTAGQYVETGNTTAGWAITTATLPTNGYSSMGLAQTAFSSTCTNQINCFGSLLVNISLR